MGSALFLLIFLLLGLAKGSPFSTSLEEKDNGGGLEMFAGLAKGSAFSTSLEEKDNGGGLQIVDGGFTSIDKYPIDVAFLIANNIWGAGVILGDSWILTTAFNCFWVEPSYMSVRVGSSNWTGDGVVLAVEECIMHPDYAGTWANNIALLKLAGNITFGPNSRLGWTAKNLTVPGKVYHVSGWGVRSSRLVKESQLQAIGQKVLSDEECNKFYNLTAATGSFCASNPNGGPCVFDFGAPLNRRRTVVGLYQGSKDCTKPDLYPALYVDVAQYIDWIDKVMGSGQ